MRKTVLSGLGAMLALAFVSVASVAAPPGDAEAIAYLVACQTADITYEHSIDSANVSRAAVGLDTVNAAIIAEHRMPGFSVSLIGDAGTTSILVSQEFGVSAAGIKSAAVWLNA